MGGRVIQFYRRPRDLSDELKKRIQDLFDEDMCTVNFERESIDLIDDKGNVYIWIPMETLGKMIGLMTNAGVTVRDKEKYDKIKANSSADRIQKDIVAFKEMLKDGDEYLEDLKRSKK